MSLSPLAILTPCRKIDKSLCLICQRKGKENLVKTPNVDVLDRILVECVAIKETLAGETCHTLYSNGYTYHSSCQKLLKLNASYKETKKTKSNEVFDDEHRSQETTSSVKPYTRSDKAPFDSLKCVLCQEDKSENLHGAHSDPRSKQLQNAFQISPRSLSDVVVRCEKARDAHAGDILYHTSCWETRIIRCKPDFGPVHEDNSFKLTEKLVLEDIRFAVEAELLKGAVLEIKDVVHAFNSRMTHNNCDDDRSYTRQRKLIKNYLTSAIPTIQFEDSTSNIHSQRIVSKDLQSLALHLAIKASHDDNEFRVLRCAAKYLRDCVSNHIKGNKIPFTGFVKNWNSTLPAILTSFIRWILAGEVDLKVNHDDEASQSACFVSSNMLYHFKTDRQKNYTSEDPETSKSYKPQRSIHHIALGLAIHQFSRDKKLIEMLSSPNYGISIPYKNIIHWETRLANAVIEQMSKNNNIYIPCNLKKEKIVQFHLDNIDFSEDTKDGRGTTHALNLVVFQQKTGPQEFPDLEVSQNSRSLTLEKNSFNDLLYCRKPNKKEYSRNALCVIESSDQNFSKVEANTKQWLLMRTFEYLFSYHGKFIWADIEALKDNDSIKVTNIGKSFTIVDHEASLMEIAEDTEIPIEIRDHYMQHTVTEFSDHCQLTDRNENTGAFEILRNSLMTTYHDLKLPSWSGMNSMIRERVCELELTNIFNLPIIPGPASDYSAIYSALMVAHGISAWTESKSSMTIISLDLDLYENIYLLVNSRDDLRNSFLLCLGELHTVFAYVRAIGTFIECSGLDNAWVKSTWFGENTVRQVLECSRMKRALECHEDTLIVLTILYVRALFKMFPSTAMTSVTDLFELISEMQKTVNEKNGGSMKHHLEHLNFHLNSMKLEELMDKFDTEHQNNFEFQFLKIYMNMVSILLDFIYASRSRDWIMHLSALKEMMPAIIMMDRIKYRRMLSVYLTEMKNLEHNNPEIWEFFMNGNFSIQKNKIPFTAIGRDHAGEQENKKMKIAGGLKGITRTENARTRFYLIGPILKDIVGQMKELGGMKQRDSKNHHHLNPSFTQRQSARIKKLVETFDTSQFSMDTLRDERLYNFITGKVFPMSSYKAILNIDSVGKELEEQFLKERLMHNSTVSIFAPVTKTKTPVFKRSGVKKRAKIEDKVYQLQSHVNFFAQCAVVSSTREIEMNEIIGKYELSSLAPSFMQLDGELNNGGDGKSALVDIICKSICNSKINAESDGRFDLVAIDAMQVVHKLIKTPSTKTFRDFANSFNAEIDILISSASSVVVAFDTYLDVSLKDAVRSYRIGKTIPVQYAVNDYFDIEKLSLKEILSHKLTKRDLSVYLMNSLHAYLLQRELQFVLAGNGKTFMSWASNESQNNHEEADSLIIYILAFALSNIQFDVRNTRVLVCSNDTDVFCLLLSHLKHLPCNKMLMKWSQEQYIDISVIFEDLGKLSCSALLGFHAFTGCDTVEKFTGISKEKWTKLFLSLDEPILKALTNFKNIIDSTNWECLERFVCNGYLPKGCKIENLEDARWHVFCNKTRNKKKSAKKLSEANMMKLPPTTGSLFQHTLRAIVQYRVWYQANEAIISNADPNEHGWIYEDEKYHAVSTEDSIAPESVVVSCNCKKNRCVSTSCTCRSFKFACTEICGCNDCENPDPPMSKNNEDSSSDEEGE